ncbi:MAG: hypothetical protein ACK41F_07875 [Fimbriimonadaceae bacterium]
MPQRLKSCEEQIQQTLTALEDRLTQTADSLGQELSNLSAKLLASLQEEWHREDRIAQHVDAALRELEESNLEESARRAAERIQDRGEAALAGLEEHWRTNVTSSLGQSWKETLRPLEDRLVRTIAMLREELVRFEAGWRASLDNIGRLPSDLKESMQTAMDALAEEAERRESTVLDVWDQCLEQLRLFEAHVRRRVQADRDGILREIRKSAGSRSKDG